MFSRDDDLDGLAPDVVSFLPSEVAVQIGRATIAFGLMEDELNTLISELLGSGFEAGQAVTFKIRSITDRFELAKLLIKFKMQPLEAQESLSAITRAEEANEKRNTLIHHALTEIKYEADPLITFRKKDYKLREAPKVTTMSGTQFKALTKEIRLTARALDGAAKSYKLFVARQKSSPEKPLAPVLAPKDQTE